MLKQLLLLLLSTFTYVDHKLNCHHNFQQDRSIRVQKSGEHRQCTMGQITISQSVGIAPSVIGQCRELKHTRTTPMALSGFEIKTTTPGLILTGGITQLADMVNCIVPSY